MTAKPKPIIQPDDILKGDTIRADWTTGAWDDSEGRMAWAVNYVATHDGQTIIADVSTVTFKLIKRRPIPPEELGLPNDTQVFGLLTWISYAGNETSRWAYWHRDAGGERMLAPHANYDIPVDRVISWEPSSVAPKYDDDTEPSVDNLVGSLGQDWTGGMNSVDWVRAQRDGDDDDEAAPADSPPALDFPRDDWTFGCITYWTEAGGERSRYGWWRSEHSIDTRLRVDGATETLPVSRVRSWQPLEIVATDAFDDLSERYAGTTSSRTKGVRDFLNDVHGTALHHAPEEPF